jgi:DNA-binding transcriptional ArsR family regulator
MSARQSPALQLRDRVLDLLADGAAMTCIQIAEALDSTQRAVMGALTALKNQGDVVAFNGVRIRDHIPLLWRLTRLPGVQLVREVRHPFKLYKPPAPTVIPVRAGNRVATPITDGPAVGMGHWTRNEYSPTEKFR